jgi:2-polyprenyl-6-methoxyphenol hydroxylase-like FAD-dependent oxidoreductase
VTQGAFEADVLIVGAGPTGLASALNLSRLGCSVIVVDRKRADARYEVKANHVSARTMEAFRRLGIVSEVRNSGLPASYPNDIAFRLTVTGPEFARIGIPARRDRYSSRDGVDSGWATPEPPHRINQSFLEPILRRHVAAAPRTSLRFDTEFVSYTQDDEGVTAHLVDQRQVESTIRSRFIIGAEGGSSQVRRTIGAKFHGDPVLQKVQSTCIRSAQLGTMLADNPAWSYYTSNPRRNGHLFAINGVDVFLLHNYLVGDEDYDTVDRDVSIRTILGVGPDFEYEVLSHEDWVARRLVADSFRDRRAFIIGDSAHLWVPFAGYGMNAGIADGLHLTWLLGSYLAGWADYRILDAYEAERQPITEQVSHFAMRHQQKLAASEIPANIEDQDEAGRQARAALAERVVTINEQQFAAAGLNFGYVYDRSPIICYDGEDAPDYSMGTFTPSTVPGCRLPHFWIEGGRSVYDALGRGYSLLCLGAVAEMASLIGAADAAGLPLAIVDVSREKLPREIDRRFVLCREDQHVVWRGDAAPADPAAVVATLRGTRPATPRLDRPAAGS